ncbi:hypothetical protein PybrP1_004394 [[Pythium] brassicae (nom. inval.)]|nr:hypothetical protein PybrP1_004394 [[Pythium] brassicae (nom. inval.)]
MAFVFEPFAKLLRLTDEALEINTMTSAIDARVSLNTAVGTTATLLPDDKRCSYPSKMCSNPRALKQDKTLHRLCEMHRRRANLNQQRLQQRRRAVRSQSDYGDALASSELLVELDAFRGSADVQAREFSSEELHILERMLFENGEYLDDDFDARDGLRAMTSTGATHFPLASPTSAALNSTEDCAFIARGSILDEARHSAVLHCGYPSKRCTNPRAIKISGELHRLCEFHRRKANLNQKRLQQRRRVMRTEEEVRQRSPLTRQALFVSTPTRMHRLPIRPRSRFEQGITMKPEPSVSTPLSDSRPSCSLMSLLLESDEQCAFEPPWPNSSVDVVTIQDAELLRSILFGEPIVSTFDGISTSNMDGTLLATDNAAVQLADTGILDFNFSL